MNDTNSQQFSTTSVRPRDTDVLTGVAAPPMQREQSATATPSHSVQIGDERIEVAGGDRIMNSATEIAGPGGADVTGGDLTAPRDADELLEENIAQRGEEQDMFRRQMQEEVPMQNQDLEPTATPNETVSDDDSRDESASGAGSSSSSAGASTRTDADSAGASSETEEDDRTRYLRALADLENFKRQAMRRENETRERTTRRVIEDILPVLDNFERAVEAAKTARDVDSVRIGIEFVAQQLRDALRGHGVEPIQTRGARFDPLQHDALEEVEGTEHEEGTVIDEVQRGYTLNGQVLRTSRVRVAGK